MKELFEQMTRTMEKTWDQWQQLVSKAPMWQEPEALKLGKWSSWIATTRSAYEVNLSLWRNFIDQSEKSFFKLFKQSPIWTETLDAQIREVWDGIKKAQETQFQLVMNQWKKMEDLLKDAE